MFLDEARIASGIDHPNVAKILDLGEWHDSLYLVMEYVTGDALSRLRRLMSKRGIKMPVQLSIRILADMCAGLHASHELRLADGELAGVVHRDVSPQNVLVPDNGSAKLIDFGVAKARDRLGGETGGAITKGKSRYMAPEQALGNPIDRRADIFAVGAMAYEIFEGNSPYEGPNDMARLHALMTGPEVKEVRSAPHPSIEKLIVKALARDPEKRFATALELRGALEDAMVQLRVRATSDDVAEFFAKHASDRIKERKRIVKLALDGAAERQRIREQLESSSMVGPRSRSDSVSEQSDSGLMDVPSVPSIDAAPAAPPPAPPRPAPKADTKDAPKDAKADARATSDAPAEPDAPVDVVVDAGADAQEAEDAPKLAEPVSVLTPPPVESAPSSSVPEDDEAGEAPLPPPNRKKGMIAIAAAGVLALLIGVGAIIARVARGDGPKPTAVATATVAAASTSMASATAAPTAPPEPTTSAIAAMAPAPSESVTTKPPAPKPTARPTGKGPSAKPTATTKKTKPSDVVIQ